MGILKYTHFLYTTIATLTLKPSHQQNNQYSEINNTHVKSWIFPQLPAHMVGKEPLIYWLLIGVWQLSALTGGSLYTMLLWRKIRKIEFCDYKKNLLLDLLSMVAIIDSAGLKFQFVTKHHHWLFGQNRTSLNALLLSRFKAGEDKSNQCFKTIKDKVFF